MTDAIRFGVNEPVEWDHNDRGTIRPMKGKVAIVLPPQECPSRYMDKLWGTHKGLGVKHKKGEVRVRDHWSYIIEVEGAKPRYRWPMVCALRKASEERNGQS